MIFDYKGDYNESKTDFVNATNATILKPYHLPFNPLALVKSSVFKPLLPTHTANAFKDTDIQIVADSNVEMSWYTFGGEYSDIYDAIMIAWCKNMGLPTDEETLAKYFKLHIERGIAHLSGTNFIKNLDDLLDLAIEEK